MGEKMWLDSKTWKYPHMYRSARWIGSFVVMKIFYPDIYVLEIDSKSIKKWHLIFHAYLLKTYYQDDKNLDLWEEDPNLHLSMNLEMDKWEKSWQSWIQDTYKEGKTIWILNVLIFALWLRMDPCCELAAWQASH